MSLSDLINKIIVQCLPLAPKALVQPFAKRYVAGETLGQMLSVIRQHQSEGLLSTVDVLGEFIHHREEAVDCAQTYKNVLDVITFEKLDANISVKLSALGLLLDKTFCYDLLADLVQYAAERQNFVRIDMEDSHCTSDTIEIYLKLRKRYSNVGIVLQAYLRRTLNDVREIMNAGAGNFRLCKGIYVESRQIAYKDPRIIHKNYTRSLEEMFRQGAYVGIATHHEDLVWEAMRLIDVYQCPKDSYEFQMLLGVDPELRQMIHQAGHRVRVYVPFGKEWYAYSLRRLKENPALAGYILKNLLD